MGINDLVPHLKQKKAIEGEILCKECDGRGWDETDFGFLQCDKCSGQGCLEKSGDRIRKTLIGPRRF